MTSVVILLTTLGVCLVVCVARPSSNHFARVPSSFPNGIKWVLFRNDSVSHLPVYTLQTNNGFLLLPTYKEGASVASRTGAPSPLQGGSDKITEKPPKQFPQQHENNLHDPTTVQTTLQGISNHSMKKPLNQYKLRAPTKVPTTPTVSGSQGVNKTIHRIPPFRQDNLHTYDDQHLSDHDTEVVEAHPGYPGQYPDFDPNAEYYPAEPAYDFESEQGYPQEDPQQPQPDYDPEQAQESYPQQPDCYPEQGQESYPQQPDCYPEQGQESYPQQPDYNPEQDPESYPQQPSYDPEQDQGSYPQQPDYSEQDQQAYPPEEPQQAYPPEEPQQAYPPEDPQQAYPPEEPPQQPEYEYPHPIDDQYQYPPSNESHGDCQKQIWSFHRNPQKLRANVQIKAFKVTAVPPSAVLVEGPAYFEYLRRKKSV